MKNPIEIILGREGGIVNHPQDKGKLTYKGISRRWFPNWEGWPVVEKTVAKYAGSLDVELDRQTSGLINTELAKDVDLQKQVREFYVVNFWNKCRGDELGDDLGFQVVDMAVNCGIKPALMCLQSALGFSGEDVDGVIGRMTLDEIDLVPDVLDLIRDFNDLREEYYHSLADFKTFGKGWLNRVAENMKLAEDELS